MSIFKFTCGKRPIRNLPPSLNFAPSFTSFPTISGGSPQAAGTILTFSYAGIGFPTPAVSYQWNLNGVPISGATASTFDSTGVLGNITVTATLANGVSPTATATSNTIAMIPPLVAPSFAATPSISGASTPGSVITVAYTAVGNPTPTASFVWKNSGVDIVGATSATYTSLPSQILTCEVTLTNGVNPNAVATSNTFTVSAVGAVISQTATFGALNFPSEGGWRPQLADSRVENIASYVGLQSGSLGAYTPTVVAPGKLAFTGANGAPNGAVLRVTGVSGRVYDVTVVQEADRRDLSDETDVNRNRTVAGNLGKKVVIRQNAQLAKMSRLIAGAGFLTASSQAQVDSGLLSTPTIIMGEGPRSFDDEYHLHSWRGYPVAETTFTRLRFADQKTDSSILIEGTATVRPKNITISECTFKIVYDVDGPNDDWSTGFGSTGFANARCIYVTGGGNVSNVEILDNVFVGAYIQIETYVSGYYAFVGNDQSDMYGDFRKHNSGVIMGPERVAFIAANLQCLSKTFSTNETSATVPHPDGDQVTSGGPGRLSTLYTLNCCFQSSTPALQSVFHADRSETQTGGHNWSMAGQLFVGKTTHGYTNDWPHSVMIKNSMILPNKHVTFPQSSSQNRISFSDGKVGDGGNLGTHLVKDTVARSVAVGTVLAATINLTQTNVVETGTWGNTEYAANLSRWADWATMPALTDYNDAMSYFTPVPGSALASVSPIGKYTMPALRSNYTVDNTLRIQPTITGLTVSNPATAAFQYVSNVNENVHTFWNVTNNGPISNARAIRRGVAGKFGILAYGISNGERFNAPTQTVICGGTAALPPGNYWLNVASYSDWSKATTQSITFTVV